MPAPFGPMMTWRSPASTVEVDVVGDDQAAERAVEMFDAQHAHGRRLVATAESPRSAPQMPPGKNITQQMKVTPMMASQCSL